MIDNEKLVKAKSILESQSLSLNLCFVTREVKCGIAKSAKVIDKYSFEAWSADVSPELRSFFIENLAMQLDKVMNSEDYELEPYDVISEDMPNRIYTYFLNDSLSFSSIINDKIISGFNNAIKSLADIKDNLWAYCLKVASPEGCFLVFRKLSKGKIVTDKSQSVREKISSCFDSTTSELKVLLQESITFDNKLDCVFVDKEFFVFKKSAFENIVGLEEEFNEAASDVVDIVKATELVEGVEHIESLLKESRSLLKTLSNIAKKGHHHKLSPEEINNMKDVLRRFEGKELKMNAEGKLVLEDKNDVGYFVKLLNDYYKQGMVSGNFYGSNGGRLLQSTS